MSHMITSISPVSMLGGAVDFSGELQMTLGSMGFRSGNLDINVVLYPSWNFGLDASAMPMDVRLETNTYTRQEVHTAVIYNETVLPNGMHATLRIPKTVCDDIDSTSSNCTVCLHVVIRAAGVHSCFMHRAPYVMMYLPCGFFSESSARV
jgi:hypothetical protein